MPPRTPSRRPTRSPRALPDLPGVTSRFVTVRAGTEDAVELHLSEAGPETGTPVILLHGYLLHWYAWHEVLPLLATDHRVICVDLRGFGWSEQTPRGYHTDSLVEDLRGLLDTLGLERALIAGHDLGARIALRLAQRSPERVSGLLALSVNHPWPVRGGQLAGLRRMWFTAFLEYPVLGRLVLRYWPGFTRYLLRRGVAAPAGWRPELLAEFVAAMQASAHAGQQVLWQYVIKDMPALVRGQDPTIRLSVPTRIVVGDKDHLIPPALLEGDFGRADDLTVRVVEGCGHQLPVEAPALVAAEVRDLVREVARRG